MKRNLQGLLLPSLISACLLSSVQASECDIEQGKKIFAKCAACHALTPNEHLMGPSLHGVIGRKAGSVASFKYSPAMASSDIVWSTSELSEFLKKPKTKLPGTVMPFFGIKKEKKRDAVICYIEQRSIQETANEK